MRSSLVVTTIFSLALAGCGAHEVYDIRPRTTELARLNASIEIPVDLSTVLDRLSDSSFRLDTDGVSAWSSNIEFTRSSRANKEIAIECVQDSLSYYDASGLSDNDPLKLHCTYTIMLEEMETSVTRATVRSVDIKVGCEYTEKFNMHSGGYAAVWKMCDLEPTGLEERALLKALAAAVARRPYGP